MSGDVLTGKAYDFGIGGDEAAPALTSAMLDLHCPGPYLTVDASKLEDGGNTIPAAGRNGKPSLPPESLMGALRQRCAWLAVLEGGDGDDPFRKPDTWTEPVDLTRTERLFGVAGWKGLVRIAKLDITAGTLARQPYMSVAIDRFSGANLNSTLFGLSNYEGTKASVTLELVARGSWPSDEDKALFKGLIADICRPDTGEGLLLGHATNRGFGWFTATRRGSTNIKGRS